MTSQSAGIDSSRRNDGLQRKRILNTAAGVILRERGGCTKRISNDARGMGGRCARKIYFYCEWRKSA